MKEPECGPCPVCGFCALRCSRAQHSKEQRSCLHHVGSAGFSKQVTHFSCKSSERVRLDPKAPNISSSSELWNSAWLRKNSKPQWKTATTKTTTKYPTVFLRNGLQQRSPPLTFQAVSLAVWRTRLGRDSGFPPHVSKRGVGVPGRPVSRGKSGGCPKGT